MIGTILRNQAPRILACAIVAGLYVVAREPTLTGDERAALAARFAFDSAPLPEPSGGPPYRTRRPVHPSLEGIAGWISSVGASVALHDLDGDGLPNDVAYVETRTDRAIVAPVPGSGSRFATFALDPTPLPFDTDTMAPMGCLPGDLNEDGLADVLVYYWGRSPIAFLRRADGAAGLDASRFVAVEIDPAVGRWYTNAATRADVDGDGHVDLIIGNYFPDDARILDASAGGRESMQHSMSRAFNGGRNRILLWAGATSGTSPTLRYREAEGVFPTEMAHAWTLAVGAADLDGDLRPELYFANDFGPDRLFHNRSTPGNVVLVSVEGRKTFTKPSSKVLGHDSFKGMGIDFADLNGDGWLDLYISNIADEYALEESHFAYLSTGEPGRLAEGEAPYIDESEGLGLSRSGWGWDSRLADFDNDGNPEALQAVGFMRGEVNRWPELHEVAMGNDILLSDPASWHRYQVGDDLSGRELNPFFVRDASGRFADVSDLLGLVEPGVSRAIATADVDGDGRLDFAVGNQWAASTFHRNTASNPGAFLGLHLLRPVEPTASGVSSHPGHPVAGVRGEPAVGASVVVTLPDGRRLVGQVDGGNGHSGKRSPDLHFGLGSIAERTALAVDLRWRDLEGNVREARLNLPPGWHTIRLAPLANEDSSR